MAGSPTVEEMEAAWAVLMRVAHAQGGVLLSTWADDKPRGAVTLAYLGTHHNEIAKEVRAVLRKHGYGMLVQEEFNG